MNSGETMAYRSTRFEMLDKPHSRIHRWLGHQQQEVASAPNVCGWQAFDVLCSCGMKFEVIR